MSLAVLDDVFAIRMDGEGTVHVCFVDGRVASEPAGWRGFEPTSALDSSTYFPAESRLWLRTMRGDSIVLEIPTALDMSPRGDRPAIYLDQNHWSTLTNTLHEPERVANSDEREAAERLVEMKLADQVVLPLSLAHLAETCKQVDPEPRYRRALTIAQLSSGWQLRDPLALRRFELRQVLTSRYRQACAIPSAAVTLEPDALVAGRYGRKGRTDPPVTMAQSWEVRAVSCIFGTIDTLLDGDPVPSPPPTEWAADFRRFAAFLAGSPKNKELLRRRTHAKFIADLGVELAEAAFGAGVSPEEQSDWTLHHSEDDLPDMPTLGLFREVLHEKLCDPNLQWVENDLTDMMYLTAGAAYCDHVVAERSHASHITNGFRRLNAARIAHPNLRSLVEHMSNCPPL